MILSTKLHRRNKSVKCTFYIRQMYIVDGNNMVNNIYIITNILYTISIKGFLIIQTENSRKQVTRIFWQE